ncbi:MAG: competence/damage-inducible protein A [Elusimicrobiota bacterium]
MELICVGSELLRGKNDLHGRFIGLRLASLGLSLRRQTLIADNQGLIKETLSEALKRSSLVLVTGGLGPTFDDLTRQSVAEVVGRRLIFNPGLLTQIKERFKTLHRRMPKFNRGQADVIEGAKIIPNNFGTAPGMIVETGAATIAILPGPPQEMQLMWDKYVSPYLQEHYQCLQTANCILRLCGLPESAVDEKIRPIIEQEKKKFKEAINFIILAHLSVVEIQISLVGIKSKIAKELERIKKKFYCLFKENIFAEGHAVLEEIVGGLLRKKNLTIAVAESCSGGLLAHRLTNVAGSSNYFQEGIVAYANKSKIERLGVKVKTLKEFGAVSGEVALEMAEGVREKLNTDLALSVTGIAGPGGATKTKPVGVVYIGLVTKNTKRIYQNKFLGTRIEIKEKTAIWALDLLRRELVAKFN